MSLTTRVVRWQGTAAVELRAGTTSAVVIPELGMLVASWTVDDVELIARPGGLGAVRRGHTSAVPLLYPWANRLGRRSYRAAGRDVSLRGLPLHTDGNGFPIHGTLIARPEWEIASAGRGRVRARFEFAGHDDLLAAFPFPHSLEVSVALAPGALRVTTTVHADAGCAVPVSFGWHPYWRLPSPRSRWSVTLPDAEHVSLDRRGLPVGARSVRAAGAEPLAGSSFDDLYAVASPASVGLTDGHHTLTLDLDAGYPFVQVYSPEGSRFCCLEPMTAPTNALVTGDHPGVAAGHSFSAGFRASYGRAGRGSASG